MEKIHKRFIDEAIRIRQEYLEEMKLLAEKEDKIKKYQLRITTVLKDIEKYVIKNNDVELDNEQISLELSDELGDIDSTMKKIQEDVSLLDKKIKKLQKESNTLYEAITKKHPSLTEEHIQEQIFNIIKI